MVMVGRPLSRRIFPSVTLVGALMAGNGQEKHMRMQLLFLEDHFLRLKAPSSQGEGLVLGKRSKEKQIERPASPGREVVSVVCFCL